MLPTHNTPQKALEFETAITERFKNPDVTQVLEFWTTDQSLVAPTSLKSAPDFSRACETLERAGWPVVERKSGGGITPQGPGVLNIALAYAPDPVETPTIQGVYQMFCSPLINLVKSFGEDANTASVPGSFCDGDYNVVVNERKLMGTAQRWVRVRALESRQVIFAHALILLDADIAAGVNAVNLLQRGCQIDSPVLAGAHTNLKEIANHRNTDLQQQQVIAQLHTDYLKELADLTE